MQFYKIPVNEAQKADTGSCKFFRDDGSECSQADDSHPASSYLFLPVFPDSKKTFLSGITITHILSHLITLSNHK